MTSSGRPGNPVPIIDIAPLANGSAADRARIASSMRAACEAIGFFYVGGHGIDDALVAATFGAARRFFHLPSDEKLACISRGRPHRGYSPPPKANHPTLVSHPSVPEPVPDNRESFHIGPEPQPPFDPSFANGPFCGANVWPAQLRDFSEVTLAYHRQLFDLSQRLCSILALSLALPADHFEPWFDVPQSLLTLNYYPARRREANPSQLGVSGHTDYGFLTVLAQDDVGGLEVLDSADMWRPAPPVPGTFLCNVGDLIERATNGHYRATRHRVIAPTGRDRCSLAFFVDPNPNALIECGVFCRQTGEAPRYEAIKCRDYLESVMRRRPDYYRQDAPATAAHP